MLDDYVVHQTVTYLNKDNSLRIAAATPRPGDARLVESQYFGGTTEYAKPSGGLSTMANKIIEFAVGQTHSYVGLFMSALDILIPEEEYINYTGTVTTLLHDHLYLQKTVEVYKDNGISSGWEPMVTSVKRSTSLQINTVYYKGKVRYTPTNKDIGLIQGQAGNFFYDNEKLISLGKSTTSPLYYNYQGGSIVKVRPNFKY